MPLARYPSLALAALIGLAITTPLVAADKPAAPKKAAAKKAGPAPALHPGDVTRAQMLAEVKQAFNRADTNHDGYMSRQEFAARMGVVINSHQSSADLTKDQVQSMLDAANRAFNDVDTNHDGKLSLAEATKRPMTAFDNMDTNHDGVVTVAEKLAAHQRTAETATAPTLGEEQGPGR